eukprot:TRINITY_DN35500_c0_g1_i1.p1 TRINITY_DN35500_c0_g1~~TRINITY_DN35500_c0_g1_i1.p1  ORF type:complete len:232 (+),score=65.57 TRINITY_DN35500_c0_g1_i1:125-820(+)
MYRLAPRLVGLRRIAQSVSDKAPVAAITARRSFAAEAKEVPSSEILPDVPMFGVGGKYASALYVSAARQNALDAVEKELKALVKAEGEAAGFADFLKDPSLAKPIRIEAIEDIAKAVGFSDITKNFLLVMAEHGRLGALDKVVHSYEELLRAKRGEVLATVTAALELEPAEAAEIKEALKSFLKPNQTLKLEQKVDRGIIGGIIVDIGETHIDLSIDAKIKSLEKVMAENI